MSNSSKWTGVVMGAALTLLFACRTNKAENGAPTPTDTKLAPTEVPTTAPTEPITFVEALCAAARSGNAAYVKEHAQLPLQYHLKTSPDKCGGTTGKRCSNSVGMLRDAEGLGIVCEGLEGIDPAKSDATRKAKLAATLERGINDFKLPVSNGEKDTVFVIGRVEGRLKLTDLKAPERGSARVGDGYKAH
ncbi:MAG: hypothetical protein IPG50_28540 [Myxococcales bacterium]|nr:hypothetical protein [Myxococcales bacterium]